MVGETGTTTQALARMNAGFPYRALKKYRQKYRHYVLCVIFDTT